MIQPRHINGIKEIFEDYTVFIFDLWGVVHDGLEPFKKSIELLRELKRKDKTILFLSNSPKRSKETKSQLETMGIQANFYDGLYTSGEHCYEQFSSKKHPWIKELGKTFFHIGPQSNSMLFRELGYVLVNDICEATFIVCSGASEVAEPIDRFQNSLDIGRQYNLPMICTNRDLCIQRKGQYYVSAGYLGEYYARQEGRVFYHGKPSIDMFEGLLKEKQILCDKNKILMIGDSLLTDIQGANSFRIDSVLILSGIHCHDLINADLFSNFRAKPSYILQECTW